MKAVIFTLILAFATSAQAQPWQPSAGHTQIPIWPGAVSDAQTTPQPEDSKVMTDPLVAGKPWVEVSNVSKPTMTVYPPKGKNTGAAVVVFPGGGYQVLAMDSRHLYEISNYIFSVAKRGRFVSASEEFESHGQQTPV